MNREDEVFGLIVQAQEMQKYALEFRFTAEDTLKKLPEASREAINDAARLILEQGTRDASRSLQEAAKETKAAADAVSVSAALLKSTGLLQGVFLLLVVLVIMAALYFGGNLLFKSRIDELNELKAQIKAEQATLEKLKSKTWGLELVNYSDGTMGIILPEGVRFSHSGQVKDGRDAVVIKP